MNYRFNYFMFLICSLFLVCTSSLLYAVSAANNNDNHNVDQTCSVDGECITINTDESSLIINKQQIYNEDEEENNDDDVESEEGDDDDDDDENNECIDENENCEFWASVGECHKNPSYMHIYCKDSCRKCPRHVFTDEQKRVGIDFGVVQELSSDNLYFQHISIDQVKQILTKARKYMNTTVPQEYGLAMLDICRNEHKSCSIWAVDGECEKNPDFMKKKCAPVCNSCEMLTIEGRCPIDPNEPNAWKPGDLDKMFQRLTSEPYLSQYSVKILSQPSNTATKNNTNNDDDDDDDDGNNDDDAPWIITMENVVTNEEAERLIELGAIEGYLRSVGVGKIKADGTNEQNVTPVRTSTNAWCKGPCYNDPTTWKVIERLSNITNIAEPNSEYLQLLRYETGQHYQTHHDYLAHQFKRQPGVRIVTLYLYLNEVEEGGGTNFPDYNITVQPKRGRALIWPSVYNNDTHTKDPRTRHQALPVIKGVKYGANAWFHQRDFKTPHAIACH